MSLNKTTLKKMKKDALVEHILKIQKDNETTTLFSSDEQEEQIQELKFQCERLTWERKQHWELALDYRDQREQLKEENKKLKEEIEEQAAVIEKMDDRMAELREIKKDITAHPDYERLLDIEKNQ